MKTPFQIIAIVFGLIALILCSVSTFGQPWFKISQKNSLYIEFKHTEYCANAGCFKYCDERPSMQDNELDVLCDSNGWRKVVFGFTVLTFALNVLGVLLLFLASTLKYDVRLRLTGYFPFVVAFIFGLVAACIYLGKNGSFKNDYLEYVKHQVTDVRSTVKAKYNVYPYFLFTASLVSLCEFLLLIFAELSEMFGEQQSGSKGDSKDDERASKEPVQTVKRPIEISVDAGVSSSTIDTSTESQSSGYVSESKSAVSSSGSASDSHSTASKSSAASSSASGSSSKAPKLAAGSAVPKRASAHSTSSSKSSTSSSAHASKTTTSASSTSASNSETDSASSN